MKKNNFPQGQLGEIAPSGIQEIVTSLKKLHDLGKPQTDKDIEKRIDDFFSFCQQSSLRPGVETLACALAVCRTTLFNWSNGVGCSLRCQELIQSAKAFICAYLEQCLLSGKISPPSGIFLAKNWLGYKDSISLEESAPQKSVKRVLTVAELQKIFPVKPDEADKV